MECSSCAADTERLRILGIPISIVNLLTATTFVSMWATERGPKVVFVREVASLMAAVNNKYLAKLHEKANLVVADGMPLVWVARLRGYGRDIGRVPGADLVDAVCKRSLDTGQTHYFFGGKPGVAKAMAARLADKYPGLKIVGAYSPPMRVIGPEFEFDTACIAEIDQVRQANPDFIWIGISSPKQEYWMMKMAPLLDRGVLFGVGAAFDFHAGTVKRAPHWMRDHGLEWAHRLIAEPRRLWWRYLVLAPCFVFKVAAELCIQAIRPR